jgi:fucose permease
MTSEITRRRIALSAFFFMPGIALASWVTRTPAIRDALGASIAEMGMVLFGLSVGSMIGILASGNLVSRFGTRAVTQTGLWCAVVALAVMALGVTLSMSLLVAIGLGFFGLGMGTTEIAVNMDGAEVERVTGKHFLHTLHGFFSLGTVFGALIGLGCAAINFPVEWHLAIVSVLSIAPILIFIPHIPAGFGRKGKSEEKGTAKQAPKVWKDPLIYLIGFVVLALALSEGAANDWLPLLMVDEYKIDAAFGSLVYLGFAIAMTTGRFGGGWFLNRFGRTTVLFASAIIGAVGVAAVVFGHSPIYAGLAVVLWGLGSSLGFPVALSIAGDSGENPSERVKLVAISGYLAFLVGPPALGFLGEAYGLRNALLVVLALVVVAIFATALLRTALDD